MTQPSDRPSSATGETSPPSDPRPLSATRRHAVVSTLAVTVVLVGLLCVTVLRIPQAMPIASAAMLLFVGLEAGSLARNARIILGVAVVVTALTVELRPDALTLLNKGLAQAVFLMSLVASLGLLRVAAQGSTLIAQSGAIAVRQPPSRRFLALSLGSHVISMVLNFGVLSLLGTMVLKGNTLDAASGDSRVKDIREQRMMTAVMQGFATMMMWSPLSIASAVIQTIASGIDIWTLLSMQFVLAMSLVILGTLIDRRRFPGTGLPSPGLAAEDRRVLLRLGVLVSAIVFGALFLAEVLGVRPIIGAIALVPAAAYVWLSAQHWSTLGWTAPGAGLRTLAVRVVETVPQSRNEIVILSATIYFGTLVAELIPRSFIEWALAHAPLPPIVIAVLLAWSIVALALMGVSQIASMTVLGQAMGPLAQMGIDPIVLAGGMMGAWALSTCVAPISTVTLVIAQMTGVPRPLIARKWNGSFVVIGVASLALWMSILAVLFDS